MSDAPALLEPDERSASFFEAAARGKLLLQRCESCAAWHFPPRRRCPRCGGVALGFAEASGRGVVHSHGRAHRASHPALRERLPLELVAVDLEEGVRVLARLAEGSPPVRAGTPVRVEFEPLGEGAALPVFRPRADGPGGRNPPPQADGTAARRGGGAKPQPVE